MRKTFFYLILFTCIIASKPLFQASAVEILLEEISTGTFHEERLAEYQLQSSSSEEDLALYLFAKGYLEMRRFEYGQAFHSFHDSLNLLEENPLDRLEIELRFYLAEMDLAFRNIPRGMQHSLRLAELSSSLHLQERLVDAYYNLTVGYRYYYDERESSKYAEEAYRLSKEINYPFGMATYYAYAADTAINYFQNPQGGYDFYAKSYEMLPEKRYDQFHMDYDKTLRNAMFYVRMAYFEDETVHSDIEEAISSEDPKNTLMLFDLYALSGDFHSYFDLQEALTSYENALDAFDRIEKIPGSYLSAAGIQGSLGRIHYELENYQEASDIYYSMIHSQPPSDNLDQWVDTQSSLDDAKYDALQERLTLLEALSIANENRARLSHQLSFVFLFSTLLLTVSIIVILKGMKKNRQYQDRLYEISITDPLTGIYNRGEILRIVEDKLSERNAVAMVDLDNFKTINDVHGHLTGDEVLRTIAQTIQSCLSSDDAVGRYGGEEFLIHFQNTSLEEAASRAEKIREKVMDLSWPKENLQTTLSIGIATCESRQMNTILHEADQRMYHGKTHGKNQVVASPL